jgi:hypothetical protein
LVHLVAVDGEVSILDSIERVLARPDLCISRASDPNEGWELMRRLPQPAQTVLSRHSRPGYIRELENLPTCLPASGQETTWMSALCA